MLTNIWTISIFERFSTWQTWQKLHPGLPWRIWLCGSQGHNSFVSTTLWLCALGQKSQTWHMTKILGLREGLEMFWRCLDSNLDTLLCFLPCFGDMAFVCWMYSTCENRTESNVKHLKIVGRCWKTIQDVWGTRIFVQDSIKVEPWLQVWLPWRFGRLEMCIWWYPLSRHMRRIPISVTKWILESAQTWNGETKLDWFFWWNLIVQWYNFCT